MRGVLKVLELEEGRWYDQREEGPRIQEPAMEEDEKEGQVDENRRREEELLREREALEKELKRMEVEQLLKALQLAEMRKETKALKEKLDNRKVLIPSLDALR